MAVDADQRSASEYHFDRDRPITFPETVAQLRRAVGVRSDATTADEWWPDHHDHTTVTAGEPTLISDVGRP